MKGHHRQKKTLLKVLAVILTVCSFLLTFRIAGLIDRFLDKPKTYLDDDYAYQIGGRPQYLVNGKWYAQKNDVETFLLIGIDKYEAAIPDENGFRNRQQSDAVFLIAIDQKNREYSILQINRDTMLNIRMLDVSGTPYNDFQGQLALSHTFGSGKEDSCENTVWSVSDYLYGLEIDHYLSLSMDAIKVMNDKLGGVTVTVLDDMTVVDKALVKDAKVTLHGDQALAYIRARGELADSSNLERMKRQRQYVSAFIERAKNVLTGNTELAYDLLLSVSGYMVSDLSAQELLSFSDLLDGYTYNGIRTIEGEARKGGSFMEFYADESALQSLILSMFYDQK